MEVVSTAVAAKEFESWLDFMEAPKDGRKHDAVAPHIERIVQAISEGSMIINEDKSITHKLRFPLADGEGIKELKYSFRLTIGEYHEKLKGVSALTDEAEYTKRKLEIISKQPRAIVDRLERRDYNLASSLTIFF